MMTRTILFFKYFSKFLCIATLFLGLFWGHVALANGPANQGYSLVSYFENDKAEMGLAEYSVEYQGKRYWFTSPDQVDTFLSNPKQYLPLFAELCPYSLTLGRTVAIDPTNFKIVGGRLLLFHRSDEMDGLEAWNNSPDDEKELLRRARGTFSLLEF